MKKRIIHKSFFMNNPEDKVLDYVMKIGNRISDIKYDLINETREKFPDWSMMLTDVVQAEFMKKLVQISGAKKGIELGVFTGYSSLSLAEGLPSDGKLTCIDVDVDFTNLASKYWKLGKVDHKIDLILKPGVEVLDKFIESKEEFDFAFVDADKDNYINYYERLLKLVKKGGFIMFDNTIWSGLVVDEVKDKNDLSTITLQKLNTLLQEDKRVEINQLPIADGLTLVYKI